MKLTASSVFITTAFIVLGLGILRYQTRERFVHTSPDRTTDKVEVNNARRQQLFVGFLPVTCHLTCPVTDFASKNTQSNTQFKSKIFPDFPTIVSALQSKEILVTFMTVPLAIKLREQNVPIKICYLGHRDGSEIVISMNSKARSLRDLKGKTIAIPSLFSNQHFVLRKLMNEFQLKEDDLKFVVLPPPDMPTSLATGSIDGYFVGEPFCAKAEMDGYGRVLYYARDIWPNFISCALVVHEDLIKSNPETVADLVRGIAESGQWAETHRAQAARIVAPYYRQDEKVLNFVLTSKPQRVSYTQLTPGDNEIQSILNIGHDLGYFKAQISISGLIDRRFIPNQIKAVSIVSE